jgi:protein-disulfide isomerase
MRKLFVLAALLFAVLAPARAQFGPPPATTFKDTSMIRPPAGSRVALWVFEDLECPACAHSFPIEREAAAKYKIPVIRKDFPLPMHKWSFDAAVNVRYIKDVLHNPTLADQYRGEVFAAQRGMDDKTDLLNFTKHFAVVHGIVWPFVVDPTGQLAAKVKEDRALGERVGLQETPTIFIATPHGAQHVSDVTQLFSSIDAALAANGAAHH